MDKLKERKQKETNIQPAGVGAFFKGVASSIIGVVIYVIVGGVAMYIAGNRRGPASLPTDIKTAPYAPSGSVAGSYTSYSYNYGWPYEQGADNFATNWFKHMMIVSWSGGRELLGKLLGFLDSIKEKEKFAIVVAPMLVGLMVMFSWPIGFLLTGYGSIGGESLDGGRTVGQSWMGLALTFLTFIFGILLLICSLTGALQSLMLCIFLLGGIFLYPGARQQVKSTFSKHSTFIVGIIALFIIKNAFSTLDSGIAWGMAGGFAIMFIVPLLWSKGTKSAKIKT